MTAAIRVDLSELRAVTALRVEGMSDHDRDEMAIPSYLHANPLIRWLMWRRYDEVVRQSDLRSDMVALEFGCGTGVFLPTLAARCKEVIAVDLFPQIAQALAERRRLNVRFLPQVDAVPDGSLDLIVAADVLEHVDDLEAFGALFRRKLRSTGRLVVSGPTENRLYKLGRIVAGFAGKGDYHHRNIDDILRTFTDRDFRLLSAQGLPLGRGARLFTVAALAVS